MKIVSPSVTLLHHTPDPERIIERAGRLCWKSAPRDKQDSHVAFIRMLKSNKHESVLEHANAGFVILTDRAIGNEIERHRIASYSQESTRYVCYAKEQHGGEIQVLCPKNLSPDAPGYDDWLTSCQESERRYLAMIAKGCKPEVARAVLPLCTKTELVMTANFRSFRNFLNLRTDEAAHPDIRIVAGLIRDELVKIAPTVFSEWITS